MYWQWLMLWISIVECLVDLDDLIFACVLSTAKSCYILHIPYDIIRFVIVCLILNYLWSTLQSVISVMINKVCQSISPIWIITPLLLYITDYILWYQSKMIIHIVEKPLLIIFPFYHNYISYSFNVFVWYDINGIRCYLQYGYPWYVNHYISWLIALHSQMPGAPFTNMM